MTIKITATQKEWLTKIRRGLNSSPPIPRDVIRQLTQKNLIIEKVSKGQVLYDLTEEGWRFF